MEAENQHIEYKLQLNDKLEREAVAFLNSRLGGDLYIGVKDNGEVVGIDDADKCQLEVSDRLKNNILPSCLGLYEVLVEQADGKNIIHVVVSEGLEKPYYIRQYGMSPQGCYLRIGSGVKPMNIQMIEGLFGSRAKASLRNIPSPRRLNHSFQQLKIYYSEHGYEINDSFLENLDLYTNEGKLNMVAYLLADNNNLSVRVAKYAGKDKCDLIENEEYGYCSLLKVTDRLLEKVNIENRTLTKITSNRRIEKRLIDAVALREALINAIVHNDYTTEEAPVVEIFSDRLTITSFGGLVNGLSQDEFFRGRTLPRNRELMRVFRDMQWVEHLGSGMHRILRAYGSEIFTISDHFVEVCFRFEDGEEIEVEPILPDEITERQRNIIDLILLDEPINERLNERLNLSQAEMAKRLGVSVSTLRRELKILENNGIIRHVGGKRSGHWVLGQEAEETGQETMENGQKTSENGQKTSENGQKTSENGQKTNSWLDEISQKDDLKKDQKDLLIAIMKQIENDDKVTQHTLVLATGKVRATVQKYLQYLVENDYIVRVGPNKGGRWQINEG